MQESTCRMQPTNVMWTNLATSSSNMGTYSNDVINAVCDENIDGIICDKSYMDESLMCKTGAMLTTFQWFVTSAVDHHHLKNVTK